MTDLVHDRYQRLRSASFTAVRCIYFELAPVITRAPHLDIHRSSHVQPRMRSRFD